MPVFSKVDQANVLKHDTKAKRETNVHADKSLDKGTCNSACIIILLNDHLSTLLPWGFTILLSLALGFRRIGRAHV